MTSLLCKGVLATIALLLMIGANAVVGVPPGRAPHVHLAAGDGRLSQDSNAASQDLSIKVRVDLVPVDVTVHGTPSRDLRATDFVIYDDGVAQEVTNFSRDQFPLTVALVVDRSGSLAPYLAELRTSAQSALSPLKPKDHVVLFTFDDTSVRLTEITQDYARVAELIAGLGAQYGTNICDAVYDAAHYLHEESPDPRRAIVLISDNYQTVSSHHSWESAIEQVREAGAVLYSIETPGQNGSYGTWISPGGADVFSIRASGSIAEALKQALTELRWQYTLGFAPSNPGKEGSHHRLTVKFKSDAPCRGCQIQARRGYYTGIQQSFRPVDYSSWLVPADKRVAPSAYSRIIAAAADASERKEIAFKASIARELNDSGQSQLKISLEIDPAGVNFKADGDRHVGKITIAVFCSDTVGAYLGADWKVMDLKLRKETYQRFLKSSIPFSAVIPLRVRRQILKVVVYDEQSGLVGSRLIRT